MSNRETCNRCGEPMPEYCGTRIVRYEALCDWCNEELEEQAEEDERLHKLHQEQVIELERPIQLKLF